ncbi:MAG: N-acyl amino acid synthase FeeM domain-containing protein [Bacteroidota bacterium]
MKYNVATNFHDIIDAWSLVYRQYLAASLIEPNALELFTFPEYISNQSAVLIGKEGEDVVCTASGILDGEKGLPLDTYYKNELDLLRGEGKRLIEIGLVADSRKTDGMANAVELMNNIARFGVQTNHLDYVVGIHPRRVNLYNRLWGFKPIARIKEYDTLKTAPVVLCHLDGTDPEIRQKELNRDISTNSNHLDFQKRYKFNPENFITDAELALSIESFFSNLWQSNKELKAA